ncbi:hypothetical protein [Clostridium butyricum]|uniref:hypothetical protein n=1 Tax=Clostridium butyricum TaxID=1492 RepID=UPI002107AE4E|nr:hypothetical protein [Clostridium butyricum]MCQ2014669.1 hypothetical protein [Clostridium butyricum]MCQ2026564.1 hypothetical protein [Clostridium butyricum]
MDICKTITLKEFDKRFIRVRQGYEDKLTGRIFYCPYDLGFNIDQDDCLKARECKECWNEVRDYLRFRDGKDE